MGSRTFIGNGIWSSTSLISRPGAISIRARPSGSHEGGIQSPTVVEINLAGVRDDRRGMRRDAEVDTAGGHAAVDARFDRQRDLVRQAALGQRRANAIAWNSSADIDDVALMQI